MRRTIGRSIYALILTGILTLGGVTSVAASSILDETQLMEATKDYAVDTTYSLLRGNNLNYGTADIRRLSSNEVHVSGITQCHRVCDTVYLELYLEQGDGDNYSSYKSWEFSKENATSLTKGISVLVPSGHYYRVRGYHAADNGSFEATSTVTSGVWVG